MILTRSYNCGSISRPFPLPRGPAIFVESLSYAWKPAAIPGNVVDVLASPRAGSRWRRMGVWAVSFGFWGAVLASFSLRAGETSEYAVKAAYIYKFGSFVAWSPTTFESSESHTNLCVVGDDPFGNTL